MKKGRGLGKSFIKLAILGREVRGELELCLPFSGFVLREQRLKMGTGKGLGGSDRG